MNLQAAAAFANKGQHEAPWLLPFVWKILDSETTLLQGPVVPLRFNNHMSRRGSALDAWNGTIILDTRPSGAGIKGLGYYACGVCQIGWRRAIISHVNDHITSRAHQSAVQEVEATLHGSWETSGPETQQPVDPQYPAVAHQIDSLPYIPFDQPHANLS